MVDFEDCLELLVALPVQRLCQVLTVFCLQGQRDRVWGLLLWVEAERERRPTELQAATRLRVAKELLPASALDRFLELDSPFASEVFELVAESVVSPLLGARSALPEKEVLSELLKEWSILGSELAERTVGLLFRELPGLLLERLAGWLPENFIRQKLSHARFVSERQRAPLLLEVLLFLVQRQYLEISLLANLFRPGVVTTEKEEAMLAGGILHYWKETSHLYRP